MTDFCLLIPCYNNYDGLLTSLRSVVYDQGKFLVVVVDDGSRVAVDADRLLQAVGWSGGLELLRLGENGGITKALNAGLAWIEGNVPTTLIARLDCGDVCHPQRFYKQVALMKGDPSLVLTGSWCRFRDPGTGEGYDYRTGILHDIIVKEMYSRNVFIHPTVMFRSDLPEVPARYPENFELAEDYAFFWTMMNRGKVAIIAEVLVTCEINTKGLSFANKGKQLFARWRVVNAFGSVSGLKLRGFSRLLSLFILPKGLILWLKKRFA